MKKLAMLLTVGLVMFGLSLTTQAGTRIVGYIECIYAGDYRAYVFVDDDERVYVGIRDHRIVARSIVKPKKLIAILEKGKKWYGLAVEKGIRNLRKKVGYTSGITISLGIMDVNGETARAFGISAIDCDDRNKKTIAFIELPAVEKLIELLRMAPGVAKELKKEEMLFK